MLQINGVTNKEDYCDLMVRKRHITQLLFTITTLYRGCPRLLPLLPMASWKVRAFSLCFGFYFFPTPPSGPPWNEGHRPRVHHETSVLEVLAPGTT